MINFNIYNLIWLGIMMLSLGIGIAQHGKRKEGYYSFWTMFLSFLLETFLLIKGGFFR